MKVFTKLALIACLSASVSALPTPDGSYGNSMIARSEDIADDAAGSGPSEWKKRGDDAADGAASFSSGQPW